MRGTNYWGKSEAVRGHPKALLPGGPGEQTCDQPPGTRLTKASLRALQWAFRPPSPLLFQESGRAASGVKVGTTEQLRPAAPQSPPARAPGRRAFGFESPPLTLLASHPRPGLHRRPQAQHRRLWKLRPGSVSPRETQNPRNSSTSSQRSWRRGRSGLTRAKPSHDCLMLLRYFFFN